MDYYISERMRDLAPSAIREMFKYMGQPGIISLTAGDPAPESLPIESINKIMGEILDGSSAQALLYSQSEGHPPLRELVKRIASERYGVNLDNNELIITSGAQQAMDLCTRVLCDEGDTIICENPSFIGALNTFRSYKCNLVGVDIEADGISIDGLEKALKENPKTRMIYVIPNFQNPTGITMSLEKRKAVYELAKKYDVLIMEDNPYGDLRFEGESLPNIKSMDNDNRVLYVGTFSKILSSGMRVGYLVAPEAIMGKIVVAKQCADVHTSMISQLICYNFLKENDLDKHIEGLKVIYKDKCNTMLETIRNTFPDSVKFTEPQGGLFVWVTLPDKADSKEFASKVVQEKKVIIVPGETFTASGDTGKDCFRINFSMPSKENIVKGVSLVGEALRETF